jgi:hypothetical protein
VFFETLLKAVVAAKLIQNPALTPSFKWFEPLTLIGLDREIATHKLCARKLFFISDTKTLKMVPLLHVFNAN